MLILSLLLSCRQDIPESESDYPELEALGRAVAEACPMAPLDDIEARMTCSENLRGLHELYNRSATTIRWGGHPSDVEGYNPKVGHSTTEFPPVTYVPTYLAQFMFDGIVSFDETDEHVAVWLGAQWRTELPLGYYPYPFNHDETGRKWDAHQYASHVILIFQKPDLTFVAGYRYGDDRARVSRERPDFDGAYTWTAPDGTQEPRVSMFDFVLSAGNPYHDDLEAAWYRAFNKMHSVGCIECHNPGDPVKMAATPPGLEILAIPAPALAAAVEPDGGPTLIDTIIEQTMPPGGLGETTMADAIGDLQMFQTYAQLALEYEAEIRQ